MTCLHHKISWKQQSLIVLAFIVSVLMVLTVVPIGDNPGIPKYSVTKNKKPYINEFIGVQKTIINLPAQLKIPAIEVDAVIDHTGITDDGAMEVNNDSGKVFWYSYGPRPGEEGSAVIAGHYGWYDGEPSVFDNLHTLSQGDIISVIDEKGVNSDFIVRESRRYDSNADTSDVFKSNDDKSHLNLITCDGIWNGYEKSYSTRLVIFTDKAV